MLKKIKKRLKKVIPSSLFKILYPLYKIQKRLNRSFESHFKKIKSFFKLVNPQRKALIFARYYQKYPIENDLILYEAYGGQGMLCNPYAIFKVLIEDPSFRNYKHFWTINDKEERKRLKKKYSAYSNINFASRLSRKNIKKMTTAKYLINNSGFPAFFSKKPGQIYLDTWHSITVKTLGYDAPHGRFTDSNVIRNILMSDYFLCANTFMTDILKKSYKMDGFYQGKVIQEGYPRNDLLIRANKKDIIDDLINRGMQIDRNKKIILYAPTWKGVSFVKTGKEAAEYRIFTDNILNNIDNKKYQVLIKPHYGVYRNLSDNDKASGQYIPSYVDTNELLSVVDILITDYSSIAFDYLHTNHPILYYIPDLESYSEYRGVYFDVNDLPGPASDKSDDIISWINNIHLIQERYYDKYQEYKNWVCAHDDGYSANRVVDIVFRNNLENKNILDISYTNKIKILMYGSTLLTNGVTSTLLNRLDNIDYNKYDVSLIVFNRPKKERNNANVLAVNSNVRVLCRIGSFSATLKETFNWKYIYKHGLYSERAKKRCPFALFERDFFRSYGNSSFDYVLDYSGYSIYYPLLLTQAKGAKRIIWEHNDLNKDINNLDKNNQKSYLQHRSNVLGAISTYPLFDKIVSVGYSAMIENRKHFATSETYNRFTFVNNLVDGDLVLKQIHNYDSVEYDNIQYYVDHKLEKNSTDWFINLNKTARKHILKTPIPLKDNINFVNMGRYSSEKNQLNLILAFAKLHQKYPNTRLYIIGEGDMRNIYERTIRDCNLQNKVYLTGRLSNPFALMNLCQCFILPSLYEGLCTAVIEARILNLPIILSKFSTSKDVSLPNGQYWVEEDINSIYRGLVSWITKQFPYNYEFDVKNFNKIASEQFEALFK